MGTKRPDLDPLDRTYKVGIRTGLEIGVRLIRKEAAEAFTSKQDAFARRLRHLADSLEEFIDKEGG